jgi:hypothetical protein
MITMAEVLLGYLERNGTYMEECLKIDKRNLTVVMLNLGRAVSSDPWEGHRICRKVEMRSWGETLR